MLRSLVLVAIVGIIGEPASGAGPVLSDSSTSKEDRQVLSVEDKWVAAEVRRDETVLREVIDDRFVFNSNGGRLSDKATFISNVLSINMVGQELTERTVLVEDDVAVVFGTTAIRITSAGGEETVSLQRYTATYIKRQHQWRAIALHMAKRETE